jgi:hypothetical protein
MSQAERQGEKIIEQFIAHQRVIRRVQRLLGALLFACLSVPFLLVGQKIFGDWNNQYLAPLAFLVSLEAMLTYQRLKKFDFFDASSWLSLGAEWLVLAVLIRVLLYWVHGWDLFQEALSYWPEQFGAYFFDTRYLLVLGFSLVIWFISVNLEAMFDQFSEDETLLRAEIDIGPSEERNELRSRLANQIILGGAVMSGLIAWIYLDRGLPWRSQPQVQVGLIALLGYFIASLVLLSLTHFAILRVYWIVNKIPIADGLTRRWALLSLLIIGGLGLIALLLPTGYSMPILRLIELLLSILLGIVQIIVFLLSLPVVLLIRWLMQIFGSQETLPEIPQLEPEAIVLTGQSPDEPTGWPSLLKAILLWGGLLVMAILAFVVYLRDHPEYLHWLKRKRLAGWLAGVWSSALVWLRGIRRTTVGIIREGWQRLRAGNPSGSLLRVGRIINPRRLPARQQVQFYYLAMLRRAAEIGLPRTPSQTPQEYEARLIEFVHARMLDQQQGGEGLAAQPEAERDPQVVLEELSGLTSQFHEARYSQHEISQGQVNLVRRYWERIRETLRKLGITKTVR